MKCSGPGLRRLLVFVSLLLLLFPLLLRGAVPRDFAIDLKATISDTAPHIVLTWTQRVQSNITAQKIHRRAKGATTWTKLADLTATQTTYTDSTALPNVEYEYWMERNLTGLTPNVAMGYLSAGVKVAEVHTRGILLLVIDDTMLTPLAPEIAQLKLDLAADGWTVQQITAPRTGSVASIKTLITNAYNADTANVKAVYLLGHVPVPYSGSIAPDGHGDHIGAWPADGYYGDMNGTWTDTAVNNTSASRAQNDNIPGDGKFDQSSLPSLVELQVGRVDLHTLNRTPATAVTEVTRLRRYLKKAHDFRLKQGAYGAIPRRTLIRDGFGHAFTSEPFAVTAWMGAFASVGQPPDGTIDEAPGSQWFSPTYAGGKDYLWGHGCGGGSYESASSFGTTVDIGHLPSRVVFTSIFGSYHGDWDADNNLMRTMLAGNATGDSLGLACFWPGRPNWFPHTPGMGETMGHMARLSMNGGLTGGGSYVPGGSSYQGVHVGLMGDPALRMHVVEPPRRLAGTSASGQVTLSWSASSETGLQGYHVYRAATVDGPFVKLTSTPQAGTTYVDATVTSGNTYTYLVRTLKLELVPGGSYYNLSIGSPVSLTVSSAGTAVPRNPTELAAALPTSSTSAVITWQDNSTDETGFRLERKTNATGSWSALTTLPANATSHTDTGPFTQGNVYHYRVIATAAAGDSVASNEHSFEAVAGFVEFTTTKTKVTKSAGSVVLSVSRFGGAVGAIAVSYATSNSSALAGTHYTTASGTLNWADGDNAAKTINVPVTNTGAPQLPRQFKVALSSATNGAAIGQWVNVAVQIEDPTATLDAAWTSAMIGSITDSSPAVSAEGVIGDSTMGGAGVTSGATTEAGRFIYQSRTGDGVLTMQVPTPTPAQSGARFAVMIRASTANNAITAASVVASSAANHGTKLAYRTTAGGAMTVTPSTDNNLDTPQWLRIIRAGSTFTAESSADGSTWTNLGGATIAGMPATAQWGIFHYSGDWAGSTTYLGDYQLATYQNVAFTGLPVPATPAAPTVGTVTNAAVPLTWTAPAYAGGYRLERRGDDGSLEVIDIPSGSTVSLSDTGIRADTAYEYRLQAYNGTGESAWSAVQRTQTLGADSVFSLTTDDPGGADALLRYSTPDANLGASDTLPITDTTIADGAMAPVTKAWLRFNLGSIPTIKSAQLKLAYIGEENLAAVFAAEHYYYMTGRLLAETSDTWDEGTITWNNAPQNNVANGSVTGTSQQVVSYFHFDASTLPVPGEVVSLAVTASTLNTNRGANNLVTLALVPSATMSGAMIWAAREHATLPPPTLEITTASTQPRRPGFLTVAPGSGSSQVLTWADFTTDETGFQIERRAANGAWGLLASPPADATTHTDTTALPGVIYEYRVRGITPAGTSGWAPTASLTRSSAAAITGAIFSTDGSNYQRAEAVPESAYVPTGLTHFPPASNFVSSVTLSTSALRNNFAGWLGLKFTTGATPVAVREVGRWVVSGNTAAHTVKIVNATTNAEVPGAAASVVTSGATPGAFAYAPLATPVTLAANTAYYLVSQETNGGDQWYEGNNTLTYATTVATVNQSVYSSNGTTYTTSYSANNSYIPVTFRYSVEGQPLVTGHSMSVLRNDFTGWLGMELTTGSTALTVSRLGRWVVAGNTGTHAVRLVNATTGVVLATANVGTAGQPAGQLAYATLPSAVTLVANTRYHLVSQETAGGDFWYDFARPAPGTASGYQQWLLANGLPMDQSGAGSATASAVSDGLPNLMKYALGMPPATRGPSGRLSHGSTTVGSDSYLTFTYVRPDPAPAGITYVVEGSSDLGAGSWSSTGIVPVSSIVTNGLCTVVVRDGTAMAAGGRRFLRLRVTTP